jgi:excisionase family DNA binding protein
MTATAAGPDMRTYMPQDAPDPALTAFLQEGAGQTPELIGENGERLRLPTAMYDVLRQVAEALSSGMAVTVAPMNARLTTQEAAEFLGVSRPTLVRMLERGDIPMEKPGRHRFVRLADLVDFQDRQQERRHAALDRMARDAAADGLYEATDDGPPPRTR